MAMVSKCSVDKYAWNTWLQVLIIVRHLFNYACYLVNNDGRELHCRQTFYLTMLNGALVCC